MKQQNPTQLLTNPTSKEALKGVGKIMKPIELSVSTPDNYTDMAEQIVESVKPIRYANSILSLIVALEDSMSGSAGNKPSIGHRGPVRIAISDDFETTLDSNDENFSLVFGLRSKQDPSFVTFDGVKYSTSIDSGLFVPTAKQSVVTIGAGTIALTY